MRGVCECEADAGVPSNGGGDALTSCPTDDD